MSRADLELMAQLRVVTLFVTTVCNAKCETCFYWENLNDDETVMSLDEIRRLSASMPPFPHLLCSGGEPFLRKDLGDILCAFAENNKLFSITIPTNGLSTDKTIDTLRQVKWAFPNLMVELGFSLDGLHALHDKMRGVKDNFEKTMATVRAVDELRREFESSFPLVPKNRFLLLTNTCVTNRNWQEVAPLVAYLNEKAPLDGMMFEALRGNPMDPDLAPPALDELKKIHDLSIRTNKVLFQRRDAESAPVKLSYLRGIYDTQQARLKTGAMPILCQAGKALSVIEPNGDVRLCELLGKVGNLRDYGMDFKALWLDHKAREQQKWVIDTRCSCTHCVNLGHSLDANPTARFKRQAFEALMRSGLSWIAA